MNKNIREIISLPTNNEKIISVVCLNWCCNCRNIKYFSGKINLCVNCNNIMCDICLIKCYDFGYGLQCYNYYIKQKSSKSANTNQICMHCGVTHHEKISTFLIDCLVKGGILFIGSEILLLGAMKIRDILDLGNL